MEIKKSKSVRKQKREKENNSIRPLRDSSIVLFEQFIREYNWSFVFKAVDVDDGVRLFLEATNSMFDPSFLVNQSKYMRMINHILLEESRR